MLKVTDNPGNVVLFYRLQSKRGRLPVENWIVENNLLQVVVLLMNLTDGRDEDLHSES